MKQNPQIGHHTGWTGPATSPIVPNLLESHLSIQVPGAKPLVSSQPDPKANEANNAPTAPNLLESHLSIQVPGVNLLISSQSDIKANEAHNAPMPAIGTRVTFQDVDYIVRNQANRKEKLKILCQVSGFFNPGEMVAVMGPSGSGRLSYPLALDSDKSL